MVIDTLEVQLGNRSYPIYIGENLIGSTELLQRAISGKQVAVITNETIAPLYLQDLLGALQGFSVNVHILPDGEQFKTLESFKQIIDFLVEKRYDRSSTIIALGGGVVGDIAGFAASAFQRGIGYLQIPTTLLSQVDSSVGGKTGVNHVQGKNLIGAFYQPQAVIADIKTLRSLTQRDYSAGLAEIIKYGIISDSDFFSWIKNSTQSLLDRKTEVLSYAIRKSCEIKARIVAQDERESGIRAILNFGHTFGHAIEALTSYREYLHGEAVAIGMVMAADISWRLGHLDQDQANQIKASIDGLGLPIQPPSIESNSWLEAMGGDKKVRDGRLRLVLTNTIGTAFISETINNQVLEETLSATEKLCDI